MTREVYPSGMRALASSLTLALLLHCSPRVVQRRPANVSPPTTQDSTASAIDAGVTPDAGPFGARLCANAGPPTASLGRARLPTPPEPYNDACPFCTAVAVAPAGADACFVSNDHIDATERQIRLAAPHAPTAASPWNRSDAPRYFDRVDAHLHLSTEESARLRSNGFVALGRHAHDSYALAFHEVFRQQLPVFISVDAILHAIFSAHGSMLQNIEVTTLHPALRRMLTAMRRTLAARRTQLPAETVADLDVYLTVAMRLFEEQDPPPPLIPANAETIDGLLSKVEAATLARVTLFGRDRLIDFSQFTPRGHYSGEVRISDHLTSLSNYFRSVSWLSRLEFNLVSRDCRSSHPELPLDRSETPREAVAALALAELAEASGMLPTLARFEQTYATFGGRREDVSLPQILALARRGAFHARDRGAFDRLRASIGNGYERRARTHPMPEGVTHLPVVTTMIGVRLVPDIETLEALVHDRVQDRTMLGFADVGYLLGHDRARAWLDADLQLFPTLAANLDAGRASLRADANRGGDLYRDWLRAVLAVAAPTRGTAPSFMRSEAWQDFRLNSALVGYAQIRHNYVLLAGEGYDAFGCEIPDGYVEPAVEVYDALLAFTRRARAMVPAQASYFDRVRQVLSTLRGIAVTERAGRPLGEAQRRWLSMVAEYIPAGGYSMESGEPPKFTGWYFDLFPDRHISAERSTAFIADYFTLTNTDTVRYLGAETTRLGVFVVDTNGSPRVMVGPVARGFETASPIATRLTDEQALEAPDRTAPWRASYMVEDDRPPLVFERLYCSGEGLAFTVSGAPVGAELSLTLLDHHGDPLSEMATRRVVGDQTVFSFAPTMPNRSESAHLSLRTPEGRRYDWVHALYIPRTEEEMPTPRVEPSPEP